MKWDIDKAILRLETLEIPGTSINRVLMDVATIKQEGLVPTARQLQRETGIVWVIGIGQIESPKRFFYGHTIRQAFLNAQKTIKKANGRLMAAWGHPVVIPSAAVRKRFIKKRDKREAELAEQDALLKRLRDIAPDMVENILKDSLKGS